MAAKKVDALKENLESEVKEIRSMIEGRIEERFSALEEMLKKLIELHTHPLAPASPSTTAQDAAATSDNLGELEGERRLGKPMMKVAGLSLAGPRVSLRGVGGTIGDSMELAQMIDDKNVVEKSNKSISSGFPHQNYTPVGEQETQVSKVQRESLKDLVSGTHQGATFKRLTETEIQNKRAKELCFCCDEKYSSGHQCIDCTLRVLTVCDEEGDAGETGEEGVTEEGHPYLDLAEVSLNPPAVPWIPP